MYKRKLITSTIVLVLSIFIQIASAAEEIHVPILVYHRFGPKVSNDMTTRTTIFAAQLQWLKDNQYTVIPLLDVINYLYGRGLPPPPKSIVITIDDGHESVYTDAFPLIYQYHIPVTLFIYPSIISKGKHALTWAQLQEMQQTGLCNIQSHTLEHPNFKREKKKLSPDAYKRFAEYQFTKAKKILEQKLGAKVDLLAWPFGIYDENLEQLAQKDGYIAAFTIHRHTVSQEDLIMELPRYLMLDSDGVKNFAKIVTGHDEERVLH
jgi:peptidoglycan/xylan/chitin deacetylase (PgdA/CDA1 family)